MRYILAIILLLSCYTQAPAQIAETEQLCNIIYGVYPDYKPYEWTENGKFKGVNIDLITALAQKAGCTVTFVSYPWNSLKEKLQNNEIDIVASSINSETLEYAVPLSTTFAQYRVLLGRKDAAFVYDIAELEGKTLLLLEDGIAYNNMRKTDLNVEYYFPSTEREALQALVSGAADYAFIDNTQTLIAEFPELKVASDPMFATLYGFIMKIDSPYFKRVNDAIESLKDSGEYYNIIDRAKDVKYARLLKIISFTLLFAVGLALAALAWNKTLQSKVAQKTEDLDRILGLLQAVLRAIPEVIYVVDRHYNILWDNIKPGSFDPELLRDNALKHISSSENAEFSVDAGGILWKVVILRFQYQTEDNFLLVASDITENVKLRDELFMTSRYSALGEMATIVAHEINNPLGCILHNLDYIEDYIVGNDEELEMSKRSVENSLDRIKAIVDELKGYTARRSKEYEAMDLSDCVRSAVGIMRFMLKRQTQNFVMSLESVTVYGSYGYIEQMIINILQNACYALSDKSQAIKCSVERVDDYARLCIADEGMGMSEDVLKNARNPYFTTRKDSGGTGLGLSLTSRLIKEHGGYMEIKSEQGKGTEIILYFPVFNGQKPNGDNK